MNDKKPNGSKAKKKALAISIVVIVVSSLLASFMSHDFGKVEVKTVRFDGSHGAILDATLYTPFGVSPDDQIPAIVTTHGAGVSKGVTAGFAEELARRGFVVLNISRYGSGASEVPESTGDDGSTGVFDGVEYLRTLDYVDKTRIGITGHSAGGGAVSAAAVVDGNYFTLNDMMINVLHDTFGQEFTKDEITMDADTLAAERLSADQMVWYNDLKAEAQEYISTRINAVLILGRADEKFFGPKAVTVGGYEVTRMPVANGGYLNGTFNEGSAKTAAFMMARDEYKAIFQTDEIAVDMWYVPGSFNETDIPTSTILGNVWDVSITSNEALADAIAERKIMVFFTPADNHSQNFISAETTTDIVKFFEQTLSYNNGELTDPSTKTVDPNSIIFLYREALNGVAMIGMVAALVALAAILIDTPYFKEIKFEVGKPLSDKKSWIFWVMTILIMAAAGWSMCTVGNKGMSLGKVTDFLPLANCVWQYIFYVIFVAVAIVIVVALYVLYVKFVKKEDIGFLKDFNVTMKFKAFAKTALLAYVLFLLAYLSVTILLYVFNEDYRFWMAVFTNMNLPGFTLMLRYCLIIFLPMVIYAVFVNFGRIKGMAEGPNTALTVVLSAAPLWITAFISYMPFYTGMTAMPLATLISAWPLLLVVPITAFINVKMYKYSGSVWLGALVNTLLIAWMLCSSTATSLYSNGSFLLKWFGL